MVEFVVAVGLAVAVVERWDDDDKVDFENIGDDDGHYYCRQLMMVLSVDPLWINYPVDRATEKKEIVIFVRGKKVFAIVTETYCPSGDNG